MQFCSRVSLLAETTPSSSIIKIASGLECERKVQLSRAKNKVPSGCVVCDQDVSLFYGERGSKLSAGASSYGRLCVALSQIAIKTINGVKSGSSAGALL